jgi:hypothetical protein
MDEAVLMPAWTPPMAAPAPCNKNGAMLGAFWYKGSKGSNTGC